MDIRGPLFLGLLMTLSYVDACGPGGRKGTSIGGSCRFGGTYPHCRVEAEVYHESRERDRRISGTIAVDNKPSVEIGFAFEHHWKKRSAKLPVEFFHVRIETSPCHFDIYDSDRDGIVNPDEIHSIFGNVDLANRLFRELDTTGDEEITLDEFNHMAPKIIHECGINEPPEAKQIDATDKTAEENTDKAQANKSED